MEKELNDVVEGARLTGYTLAVLDLMHIIIKLQNESNGIYFQDGYKHLLNQIESEMTKMKQIRETTGMALPQ